MGQVQVRQRQLVGMEGEDSVIIMIQLHRRFRPRVQYLHDMGPHRIRKERRAEILFRLEIVDGRAVEQNGRAVHGQAGPHDLKGGEGAACGNGECAALGHEVFDGLPVFRKQFRHGLQPLQRVFGIDQRVVKIAGKQYACKLSHLTYASLAEGVPLPLLRPRRPPRLRRGRRCCSPAPS